MEEFTVKQLKSLAFGYRKILSVYLLKLDSRYMGAKKEARRCRVRGDKNGEVRVYREFREETGLSMREFCKLRRLCGLPE